jgi:hypothetical protein
MKQLQWAVRNGYFCHMTNSCSLKCLCSLLNTSTIGALWQWLGNQQIMNEQFNSGSQTFVTLALIKAIVLPNKPK